MYCFGREGGHRKEYSVYAFDNVDNSERLLNTEPFKSYMKAHQRMALLWTLFVFIRPSQDHC